MSGKLAQEVRSRLKRENLPGDAMAVKVPEKILIGFPGVIATSDTAIIDQSKKVLDLAGYILRKKDPIRIPCPIEKKERFCWKEEKGVERLSLGYESLTGELRCLSIHSCFYTHFPIHPSHTSFYPLRTPSHLCPIWSPHEPLCPSWPLRLPFRWISRRPLRNEVFRNRLFFINDRRNLAGGIGNESPDPVVGKNHCRDRWPHPLCLPSQTSFSMV